MNTETLINRAAWRTIKFPLVRKKGREKHPRLPVVDGIYGAAACTARMVRSAISYREQSFEASRSGNAVLARHNRRSMRGAVLWARIFAGHFDADDARVLAEDDYTRSVIARYNRADIWMKRWEKVRSLMRAGNPSRVDALCNRIAEKYNAINPYGYTLRRVEA